MRRGLTRANENLIWVWLLWNDAHPAQIQAFRRKRGGAGACKKPGYENIPGIRFVSGNRFWGNQLLQPGLCSRPCGDNSTSKCPGTKSGVDASGVGAILWPTPRITGGRLRSDGVSQRRVFSAHRGDAERSGIAYRPLPGHPKRPGQRGPRSTGFQRPAVVLTKVVASPRCANYVFANFS